jgi:hypothetical protein
MEEANLKILNYAALALLAVVATPTAALADRINADAPDAATGSFCVPTGIYQIEQNVQVDVAGGVPSLGFPSLHRFGVAKDLELRLESPILAYSQPGGLQRDWVALEAKYNLEQVWPANLPPLALFATARLEPTNTVTPTVTLCTDIALPADFGLNANLGAEFPGSGPTLTYAASFDHPLWGEDWSVYAEAAGGYDPTGGLGVNVDGGFKYFLDDDSQVMLAAGTDAKAPGSTYYVTTNWSHRFGKY